MIVRFLIIRFSSIGDIVLTTPVIRHLKEQVEGAEIHYLTKKQFQPVLNANPYIDRLWLLDGSVKTILPELKAQSFDYIIDLHHNLRSSVIKNTLQRISFDVNKLNFRKWLLVNFKINRLPDKHIVDRYMDTISLFDIQNDGKGLDYFIPPEEEIDRDTLPAPFNLGYTALVVGAQHATKMLPLALLAKLGEMLDGPVILLGGPGEKKTGEDLCTILKDRPVFNACGKFSINQSASLIRQAAVVITPDTGMMHIAAAFRKPILSVWGNTVPSFGMSPYLPQEDSRIFEVHGLSCRPCSKIGYEKCPKEHFRCMLQQPCEDIAGLANRLAGR